MTRNRTFTTWLAHGARALALAAFGTLVLPVAGAKADATDKLLANEQDGANWASYGRTFSEWHYSPLKQIDAGNVNRLGLAWSFDLPDMISSFSAPLAVDGTLYFAVGLSYVHAMDAQTGKLLWKYDPEVAKVAGEKLRGAWGIRGLAYWEGSVIVGTQDGRLLALDAKTGALRWSVKTTEENDKRYITGPPWVFDGKVAIGHGGADFDARGYMTVYDAATGKQLWRFWTVPGNPANGFENKTMEMAAKTWSGEWWKFGGGGTVWNAMAYDRKLNRLYIGTGNGTPWNWKIRSPGGGDNLFLSSIIALDADTGEYIWHYQTNPGESWDYNANMDIQLADITIDGKRRPVIMQAPKNGFFYVLDRETGKLISAEKIANVTWAERIDLQTGRPVQHPKAHYPNGEAFLMCPGPFGAHNLAAMSFNPGTGLVYIPKSELCMPYQDPPGKLSDWKLPQHFIPAAGIGGSNAEFTVPDGRAELLAWNPATQKAAWSVKLPAINSGGTATTAGNLVFHGTAAGEFRAHAADTGEILWSFDAKAGIQAQPITYLAGGKQYVTVIVGWRGVGAGIGLPQEWDYRTQPRRVLTFALGAKGTLPASEPVPPIADDPAFVVDPAKAQLGMYTFETQCFLCHGGGVNAGGAAPELRRSPIALTTAGLKSVVHDGALESLGMPRFAELSDAQIEGIVHYVRQQARATLAAQQAATPAPAAKAAP